MCILIKEHTSPGGSNWSLITGLEPAAKRRNTEVDNSLNAS